MPMPRPEAGETEDEFLERCISFVMDEGTAEDNDQALAICMGIWEDRTMPTNEFERRMLTTGEMRLVEGSESERPRILGYAAVFNQRSEDLGGFVEVIAPGAFSGVLSSDVRALWNHNRDYVLGRTTNGTLQLRQDDHGLQYEIDPPDTLWAADALESIRRGDVTGSSFTFRVVQPGGDSWEERDGLVIRTVRHVAELQDVSPVAYPAYPQTSAEARSQAAEIRQTTSTDGQEADGEEADGEPGYQVGLEHQRRRLELLEV